MKEQLDVYYSNIKKIYPKLKPTPTPYDQDQIAIYEQKMNLHFTDELKEWFQLIGNADFGIDGFLAGMGIYSIEEMYKEWVTWREYDDDAVNDPQYYSSEPEGYIKHLYTHPKWIPLGYDYGCNYIGVDLTPEALGTVGQIINFGRDEDDKKVIANSIKAYLQLLIDHQPELIVSEEIRGDYYINPKKNHPNDWIKAIV